jgi:hypothetical protein
MLLAFLLAYALMFACALAERFWPALRPAMEAWAKWQDEAGNQLFQRSVDPISGGLVLRHSPQRPCTWRG